MVSVRIALMLAAAVAGWGAGTRRALLVGINTYEPPPGEKAAPIVAAAHPALPLPRGRQPRTRGSWRNLSGAVNDARAMKQLLMERLGFDAANIVLLEDRQATRQAILDYLGRCLLGSQVKAGDATLFYFAGHGSQVFNSKSPEQDHLDESLVPADAWSGVADIRDKELARILNRAIDRGVVVTMIADSCHSGSIARGPRVSRSRAMEYDPRDAGDPPDPRVRSPQERGALVLSAASEQQEARERSDGSHGLFTWALTRALATAPADIPVSLLFQRVRSLLQGEAAMQEPVLAGAGRQHSALLGGPAATYAGAASMAVQGKLPGGIVRLAGGLAAGLREGCELVRLERREPEVRLRVKRVPDLAQADAEFMSGTLADVARGDLFVLDRWVTPGATALRVQVADDAPPGVQLERFARVVTAEGSAETSSATHWLQWEQGEWVLRKAGSSAAPVRFGVQSGASIRRRMADLGIRHTVLRLPAGRELAQAIRAAGSKNGFEVVESAEQEPHYMLAGRWNGSAVEYAWVAAEPSMNMPAETDWIGASGDTATRLGEYAARLARIRGWLQLESPPFSGFPYRLSLVNRKTLADRGRGPLVEGEQIRFALTADGEPGDEIAPRWVYVFAIDGQGQSRLLFPDPSAGNEQNLVPPPGTERAPRRMVLGGDSDAIEIGAPFGVDTYCLLTTSKPLPDPGVLEFDGVENRAARGAADPLSQLLVGMRAGRRRESTAVPANWSIERVSLRSVAR